jgi:hypothetical protein
MRTDGQSSRLCLGAGFAVSFWLLQLGMLATVELLFLPSLWTSGTATTLDPIRAGEMRLSDHVRLDR